MIQTTVFAEGQWKNMDSGKIRPVKGQQQVSEGEIKLNTMTADKGFLYGLKQTKL